MIGLDDSSLFGRPDLVSGNIQDIFAENAFIAVKDSEFYKLKGADIGSDFELNDHRGVIVGIARVASSGLFGVPTLYTTYFRALQYIPTTRFTISYVLVEPKTPADVANIKQQVSAAGYLALTKDEFVQQISNFYMYQTGFGTNLLIMTVISFLVGLSISGQTFYTFILENIEKFGALKAIGAKGRELVLHDPVPGDVRVAHRLRCRRRLVCDGHLAGATLPAGLCGDHHLLESRYGLRHGGHHRVDIELCRGAQGAHHRTIRHLPGLAVPHVAIQAAGLNKWFGEGEARTHAVKDASFEATSAKCCTSSGRRAAARPQCSA